MHRPPERSAARVLLGCALALLVAHAARAQTPLKSLDGPGGGRIVYGAVDGAHTEAQAMGQVLGVLHRQYGDKPQVGRVFQVKGTGSAAVFFTLVNHNQKDAHIAGLLIASASGGGQVEAALLSDDAARFGKSVNPMLKTLFQVWHPNTGAASSGRSAPSAGSAPAQPLEPYVLPDRSASVSLPARWKVEPTSGGGTILADGPDGESVALDFPMLAMNSNDPRVRKTMQFAQGAGRNTVYARALYYPYGNDPGRTFADLLQMMRRMRGLPQAMIQVAGETPVPGGQSRCTRLEGHIDPKDGKGEREFNTIFCSGALSPMGQYMNIAFHTAVPLPLARERRATMTAILDSFKVNSAVVNQQAAAIAAPAIAQIHAIGRAAAEQAAQAHAAEDRHNASVEARWDSQDKHNQAFSNYLLDQSVIADNENNGHATVWNKTAEALVAGNPDRFSYVETPNFWKGVDY